MLNRASVKRLVDRNMESLEDVTVCPLGCIPIHPLLTNIPSTTTRGACIRPYSDINSLFGSAFPTSFIFCNISVRGCHVLHRRFERVKAGFLYGSRHHRSRRESSDRRHFRKRTHVVRARFVILSILVSVLRKTDLSGRVHL